MEKVILEGCNGIWASQRRYLPMLLAKAAKGEIDLLAIDVQPAINLTDPEANENWTDAESRGTAHYLNKVENASTYHELADASCVFVVTPDYTHSEVATFWLDRLTPEGKIIIEKPLDASITAAESLKKKLVGRERVFAFDHDHARAWPFLQNKDVHLKKIGKIKSIDFRMLEHFGIPSGRVRTLESGIIFDLYCHGLSVIYALEEPHKVTLREVKGARCTESPITGDTFAYVSLILNDGILVNSVVGKFVGTHPDSFMTVTGESGRIDLDYPHGRFAVFDAQGNSLDEGDLNPNLIESLIDNILIPGRQPLDVPGVFSFNTAFTILQTMHDAVENIEWLPDYQWHSTVDQIMGK